MKEHKFLISVVIPTCHRNDLLSKCLDCLAPGVQTLIATDYEVIVSDDGVKSTAETMIRERYPWVKWVSGPRRGPAANRNNGVKQAQGKWIAFTDDDCLPESHWLAAYAQHTDAAGEVLEGKTTTEPSKGLFYVAPQNLTGGYLWSCNMMISRDVFDQMRGFDEKFPYPHLEDVDLHLRLKNGNYKIKFVSGAVVLHPLRPMTRITKQAMAHESDWYMSRKHQIPLRDLQIHPLFFWKGQLRYIIKNSRSPLEMLHFFFTRSCIEAFLLLVFSFRWNKKYKFKSSF